MNQNQSKEYVEQVLARAREGGIQVTNFPPSQSVYIWENSNADFPRQLEGSAAVRFLAMADYYKLLYNIPLEQAETMVAVDYLYGVEA